MGSEINSFSVSEAELIKKVQEYCVDVNHTAFILLIIAGIFWLLEPLVYKQLQKLQPKSVFLKYLLNPSGLIMFYKWIGIGLLFMAGYVLWLIR